MRTYGDFSYGVVGQNISPDYDENGIFGTFLWQPKINENLAFTLGTMPGFSIKDIGWTFYNYGTIDYIFCKEFTASVGLIFENKNMSFTGSSTLYVDKFQFSSTYISGNSQVSEIGLNIGYSITEDFKPYVGYSFSNVDSRHIIIGLNYNF